MKLVGYIRVSSESQEDNTSLTEQERKIKAYCDAYNHELLTVFKEVGSGKSAKSRPQFQAALESVKTSADGIISTKLDRIARNCRDVLTLVEDVLQPNNKALVLIDINADTSTPVGKMMLTVMAAVAELERSTINERTQGGRKAKSSQGGYAYGSPKFGQSAIDKALVPNDEELEVIAIIKRHHKSGKTPQKIAEYLNANGYAAKRGGKWHDVTVKRVIDRELKPARNKPKSGISKI